MLTAVLATVSPISAQESSNEFTADGFHFRVMAETEATVELTGDDLTNRRGQTISLPSSVTNDGRAYSVVRIGSMALCDEYAADSILIPTSVKEIGRRAFYGTSVEAVIFEAEEAEMLFEPESFTGLSTGDIVPFIIPDGTTVIPDSCFYQCEIGYIYIPESVEQIGSQAFADCEATGSLFVLRSIPPETAPDAFNHTIREIYVPTGSEEAYESDPAWKVFTGNINEGIPVQYNYMFYMLDDDTATLVSHPQTGDAMYYTYDVDAVPPTIIVDGITYTVNKIGSGCFYRSYDYQTLSIPPTITEIGSSIIRHSAYREIVFEESDLPLTLSSYIFEDCSLRAITIPDRVTALPDYMMYMTGCLNHATLPAGLTSLGTGVFSGCPGMDYMTVKAVVPPTATEESFDPANFGRCVLYVPEESVEAYAAAEGWKMFERILPISSALSDVSTDCCGAVRGEVYGTDGSLLRRIERPEGGLTAGECCSGLPAGIYPVRLTDASGHTTTVKAAVR